MGFKQPKLLWTLEEKKKLLELYKTETDWQGRSAKMCSTFTSRKIRGFFSPNACQAQFDELMASPCPGQTPTASGRAGYSLKAVVDMWIEHLRDEISKDYERQNELYMVEVRNCYSLVDRILAGKPEMNEEQLISLLEEARGADAKSGREDAEVVTNLFIHKLMDAFKVGTPQPGGQELPPTKRSEEVPRGAETAFRSPSPSRSPPKFSPLKSPIRPVAETMRDGLSPQAIKCIEVRKEELRRTLSPVKKAAEKTPASPAKRAPVKEKPEPMEVDNNNVVTAEKSVKFDDDVETTPVPLKKRGRKSKASANQSKLNNPRDATASPTPEPGSKRNRSARKSGVSTGEPQEKKEKPEPSSATPSLAGDVIPSVAVYDEKFSTCSAQTDITIISASTSSEKERKERRQSTTRKTSGRRSEAVEKTDTEVSPSGEHRDVGIQCQRLEFDRDDKICVTWYDMEKPFVPTVTVKKEAVEFDEAPSRRPMTPAVDDEPEDRRLTKAESKREFTVIYDTEEWVARSLLQQPNFSIETENGGTLKRPIPRKDDRSREENIQIKSLLMNTWRAVFSHRHSGIFAHPVSDRDAPGYQNVVKQRMDLQTLKREVENGVVTTPEQMKHRLMRMFANAVMFNSSGHDVNTYAKEMARDTMAELSRLIQEGLKGPMSNHHPRRSKMAEEHSSRPSRPEGSRARYSALLKQTPHEEFTSSESRTRKVFRRKPLANEVRKVRF